MWLYAGGDSHSKLKYWKMLSNDKNLSQPAYTNLCICGHPIVENCYLFNKNDNRVIVSGNCCIRRFIPEESRGKRCSICNGKHKNIKDNFCKKCRITSVIQFGKYKSKTFDQVYQNDPDYCSWFIKNVKPDGNNMVNFFNYLKSKPVVIEKVISSPNVPVDVGDEILKFGKHSSKQFKYVYEKYPGYCDWFIENFKSENDNAVKFFNYLKSRSQESQQTLSSELDGIDIESLKLDDIEVNNDPGNQLIQFGKYKLKTFNYVYENDQQYCDWMINNRVIKGENAKAFVNWVKDKKINS